MGMMSPIHRLLAVLLPVVVTACTTLPEPRLAEAPAEQSHTVAEIAPGRYHVMVRGATFAPSTTTERLLRDRAARLCGKRRARIRRLEVIDHPAMASGEVTCEAAPEPPATATAPATTPAAALPPSAPPTAPAATPRHPASAHTGPVPMVASGSGLLPQPPPPGYIPPFARINNGLTIPKVAARPRPGDGWMPATGEAPAAAPVAEVEEDEIASHPFWPQVKETYRTIYAGGEE